VEGVFVVCAVQDVRARAPVQHLPRQRQHLCARTPCQCPGVL
jgi:hypothetical protein